MATISDYVLDAALSKLDVEANAIYLCSLEPTTYAAATSTNALGNASGASYPGIGAPVNGTPNGRAVSSAAVTNGVITGTGTATHFAIVDTVNSRLLATGALNAAQPVNTGNTFTMTSFTVRIPDPV